MDNADDDGYIKLMGAVVCKRRIIAQKVLKGSFLQLEKKIPSAWTGDLIIDMPIQCLSETQACQRHGFTAIGFVKACVGYMS